MSELSPFQSPNNNENEDKSEAQQVLDQERQLPLTGWQQEAAQSIKDRTVIRQ